MTTVVSSVVQGIPYPIYYKQKTSKKNCHDNRLQNRSPITVIFIKWQSEGDDAACHFINTAMSLLHLFFLGSASNLCTDTEGQIFSDKAILENGYGVQQTLW
jgi:hypothetical protein